MAERNGKMATSVTGGKLLSRVQRAWGPGPLHQAKLNGPAPDRLYLQPDYPRTPNRTLGEAILRGRLSTAGQSCDIENKHSELWALLPGNTALFNLAHGFEWLNAIALIASEDETLQPGNILRTYIESWLDRHEKWSPDVWRPKLVAERLMHWCCHGDFILKRGDALWRSRVLTSMARQARHLAQIAHKAPAGTDALITAMGLSLTGLCLPACDVALERGHELMRRELRLQLRSDGGHISRNPSTQLEIVIRLQMIANAYQKRGLALPGYLRLSLARAAAMVQFFRCPDGALAVFNGGYEDDSRSIIAAASVIQDGSTPVGFARYTQYQRISAARALLIADVGSYTHEQAASTSPKNGFNGAGSFHLSSGRNRLVGNCGSGDHLDAEWAKALRQDSAHSGLSFEGDEHKGLFSKETLHQRSEEVSGVLLEITRPFTTKVSSIEYAPPTQTPGWLRRLYVAAGGDDIRGEERLIGLPRKLMNQWRFRFHLHPGIKGSVTRDEQSVILACPNQEGWRFRTNIQGISLENSVYCGDGAQPMVTQQIVIAPSEKPESRTNLGVDTTDSCDIIIKWAFKRLDGV